MEYNSNRIGLTMKEYGRYIQKMVDFIKTIEDDTQRQQQAELVVELMALLNPHLKIIEDYKHMLWDHLFYISQFELNVQSPYPLPDRTKFRAKPSPLPYPKGNPKYRHLGKHIESVINKALEPGNEEKKVGFANSIAYYMKLTYNNWHKELIHDNGIRSELNNITNGQLEFDSTPFVKSFRTEIREGRDARNNGGYNNRFKRNNAPYGRFKRNPNNNSADRNSVRPPKKRY